MGSGSFLITCIPRVASAFYWLILNPSYCGSVSSVWSSGYQMSSCFGLRTVLECWGVGTLWPSHCPCLAERGQGRMPADAWHFTADACKRHGVLSGQVTGWRDFIPAGLWGRAEKLKTGRWPLALIHILFWNHFGFFRIPSRGFQILMYLKITQGRGRGH